MAESVTEPTSEPASAPEPKRDMILTFFAICFLLLAISNSLKPLQLGGEQTGFVLFGARQTGSGNLWGLVFGLYLFVYAFGIWKMKRFVVGMAHAYALYVILNLLMFWANPPESGSGGIVFGIVYSVIAVGVSGGAAFLLTKRKSELA